MSKIVLGFEEKTGEEVCVQPSHLIVTGVTQLSGKTTTLEALIKRSGLRAIVFKTKIGERVTFGDALIPPYYMTKSDWQYTQSLLEATLKERLKFERAWLIRACKGTTSLFEVKRNIDELLAGGKLRSMDRDIFTTLQAYLEIVLPQLEHANFSHTLELGDGINVMDLERFKEEIQSLVIRSTLEKVLTEMRDTIVVVPEAWRYIPQGRGNPVKPAVDTFIRQGATNGNYLFIDSQDLAAIDKSPLKQVSTWILGLQTERNEVAHTLDQISVPKKQKPSVEEVMTLPLGHFILVTPRMTKKVYVQPAWMNEEDAQQVALGARKSEEFKKPPGFGIGLLAKPSTIRQPTPSSPALAGATREQFDRLNKDVIQLREDVFNKFRELESEIAALANLSEATPTQSIVGPEIDVDDIVRRVLLKVPTTGGGTVKVAPREVVLKEFQATEVERILKQAENFTPWQKQVLKFVEAKGIQTEKPELLTRLLGKNAAQLSGTYKQLYAEADELAAIGFLRSDQKKRLYPNLANEMKARLEAYGATEADISDVVGQILVRLK